MNQDTRIYTSPDAEVGTDSDDEDDTAANQQEPLKQKLITLEEVSRFLEYKGHGDEALSIGCTIDRIVNLKHAPARQTTVTTLHDYFTH